MVNAKVHRYQKIPIDIERAMSSNETGDIRDGSNCRFAFNMLVS